MSMTAQCVRRTTSEDSLRGRFEWRDRNAFRNCLIFMWRNGGDANAKKSGITPGFSEKHYGPYFTVDLGLDVLFLALADLVRTRVDWLG